MTSVDSRRHELFPFDCETLAGKCPPQHLFGVSAFQIFQFVALPIETGQNRN